MKLRPAYSALALVASVRAANPLAGQASTPADSAIRTARVELDAIRHGDYLMAARLTDPAELHRNRVAFDSLLVADSSNYIAHRFFRLDSTAQVRRLPDDSFNAALMTFQFGVGGTTALWATMAGVDIAGALPQGRDTVLVVYKWRFAADSAPLRSFNVETMIRCPSGWCANMSADLSGMLRILKPNPRR